MNTSTQIAKTTFYSRPWFYRLMEMVPGLATWTFLLSPVILSLFQPAVVAYFIIGFDLLWLVKSLRMSTNLVLGYRQLYLNQQVDWNTRLRELEDIDQSLAELEKERANLLRAYPGASRRWHVLPEQVKAHDRYRSLQEHLQVLQQLGEHPSTVLPPSQIINAVIIATFNESREVLEPSVQAIAGTHYDPKQMVLIIAYEERGGEAIEKTAHELIEAYGDRFLWAAAIKHPDGLAGEAKVKGANLSYAGRQLTKHIEDQGIDPERVIVTTFDADHRPAKNYFSYLAYSYAINVNRVHKTFQPIPMFLNNIWDVPAPMRLISTGNSFWIIMEAMRPRHLRNFAAHAQSLKALIDTDYWSVTSIVEDGHQYWRTYFTYDGDHEVLPLFTPVYQDAVLAKGYLRTFRQQYIQLRRWAWGACEFAFVVTKSMENPRIPLTEKIAQTWRLFEGHFSWATSPLILTFVAWLPLFLNRRFSEQLLAHELPVIASRILTLAMLGLIATVFISLLSLPPKPPRYHRARFITMVLQWIMLPVVAIVFGAFAAIDAQTRLMIGRYLDWRVTEKAVKN